MTTSLQRAADVITQTAGWRTAVPDGDGVIRFALEGDLDFELLSPEGRTGVFRAALAPAPSEQTAQGEEELRRVASLAVACLKKRKSILSIAEGSLELHRTFPLSSENGYVIRELRDFLNDFAWWKKQLTGGPAPVKTSSDTFSFNLGSWFSGDL